ncbi:MULTISPECIES: ABC transporter ATP-binding protein [Gordonia]|uniref:ABC transporter n=2 Tax=Gordoniaceae TaxID=85026 RepID=W9D8Y4_9ACTN|nr:MULTISPECIES: ABC transporter ATP-binding protein [Gordonia]ETA04774.1 ABC transporter [Gordonia alkanivorans CGMCC 6845]MDH3008961.1 ABC transporter ATP-binding protein [Gordonia alkanivorans]MDH3010968.1 ABC transporter ATP-binding protein [Gordonia alkanivorans]MDH3017353.1 ABC transporter ATP-binding protein [Gordonia alkanivorans]MDH3042787.1 ABC transporter ATP-binding protein [Gordonia alkanivorans]
MGVEVSVEGLTKSFGSQNIWRDVTLTLPEGEVSALLGPSGTGKSVFLKTLIGLLHPEQGSVIIDGTDITQCSAKELYEIRKLFGVLFQDGALFGSMSLFDNIAFPLREHTKKKENEVRDIVMEKIDLVGLTGAEDKLPGEISGGMRKRAGLARALVLDPQIILCDEPDSGLDPVRTAYISQLLIDINAQIDATILIVTHNINIARTIPDNIGMLFRKELVMFGPREQLLTSEQPVVKQFLSGDRFGPIGMSEEKDEAVQKQEEAMQAAGISGGGTKEDFTEIIPQVQPNPGMPERKAIARHRERVHAMLPDLPENAQEAIRRSQEQEDQIREESRAHAEDMAGGGGGRHGGDNEWTSAPAGNVAVADAKTDVIDYGGSDAPTEQWQTPGGGDALTKPSHRAADGNEGRTIQG